MELRNRGSPRRTCRALGVPVSSSRPQARNPLIRHFFFAKLFSLCRVRGSPRRTCRALGVPVFGQRKKRIKDLHQLPEVSLRALGVAGKGSRREAWYDPRLTDEWNGYRKANDPHQPVGEGLAPPGGQCPRPRSALVHLFCFLTHEGDGSDPTVGVGASTTRPNAQHNRHPSLSARK